MEDYEKLYKDVLAKAREIHRNENEKKFDMEWLFPELADSNDERIRKALLEMVHDTTGDELWVDYNVHKEEALTWLEKQESVREVVERCKNSWYNEGKIAGMAEGLTNDEKYQQGWHDALEKQCQTFTKKDVDDAYLKGVCDAKHELEKQGTPAKLSEEEQNKFAKGVLSSCALSFINYLDAHKYEGKMCVSNLECEDIENAFHNAMWDRLHRYYCKYIDEQGEQKPSNVDYYHVDDEVGNPNDWVITTSHDKVEPKFKVGDKVYNIKNGLECTIESIDEMCYYCDMTNFDIKDQDGWKLVEQKPKNPADNVEPIFSIGDVLCDKSCTTLNKNSQPNIEILDIRNGMYICNNCIFPISQQNEYELVTKKIEPQPAWSDEDEKMYKIALSCIETLEDISNGKNMHADVKDWLKSLKDRIGG